MDQIQPPTYESLIRTIQTLDGRIWKKQLRTTNLDDWSGQFVGEVKEATVERLLALALLARFTYFGIDHIRVLLRSLFHDTFCYRIVEDYRRTNMDTVDGRAIRTHLDNEIRATKFIGLGGASESGQHVIYYFRQMSGLPVARFATSDLLVRRDVAHLSGVRRLVLVDDICGSGSTATRYGREVIRPLLAEFRTQNWEIPEIQYLTLCGLESGVDTVRKSPDFNLVEAALLFDKSHRVFSDSSRYFPTDKGGPILSALSRTEARDVIRHYGAKLTPRSPLGVSDGQLMVGFEHNTPNNTLPVFWSSPKKAQWISLFDRYGKA